MAWDPNTYMKFGAERTRPAAELLARVPVEAPARVIDLGCGPGNSTELLAQRWPDADVTGLDSSPEMIAQAKASGVKAKFALGDVATWSPDKPFDVVYSNATLQWIGDHKHLLPRLIAAVATDGVFAFQVPCNFGEPSHTLLYELAENGPWAQTLTNRRDRAAVLKPDAYFDILEPLAKSLDIWETTYTQVLSGEDAVFTWMSGTGLRPFSNALEGEERETFLAEYKRRLARAYPVRASGNTLYPFQRLFCVATRQSAPRPRLPA
ncbi:MAG TPA: trans-aconitate 2-methyltransferase [Rhizomicrobium sp.]|jgi:trans-aconitate 2-methyltransferase